MTGGTEQDPGLPALVEQIRRAGGFACDGYKESCLRRRLAVRMRARGVGTLGEYARLLDTDSGEYQHLLDALTITVTKFFRNRGVWDALAADVLPGLWHARAGPLRCWSAGCATGEEPYTLAILLLEQVAVGAERGGRSLAACIDATDLDRESLARAARGVYPETALVETSPAIVARYFSGPAPHELAPEVRALVRLLPHDLLRDPAPAPPYDVILCRNVLIYFDRRTQQRLFATFADALSPGGVLVLGKTETLSGETRRRLRLENVRERIYRRI